MITKILMSFPSQFHLPHTKVLPRNGSILSNLFSNCMQYDIMSRHLSLTVGLKKPRLILVNS